MIHIINFQFQIPKNAISINTTSSSLTWSRSLSPFFVGPIDLYAGYKSINMENCWQYSKVYGHTDHVDENNNPTESYFSWAQKGWADVKAHRYPMGKGMKPLFSFWDGEKLDYVSARKRIYLPKYAEAVSQTYAWTKLKELYQNNETIYLIDYDAHNTTPGAFDYWDFWNNPQIKVGHAYVLAMMLEKII